CGAKVVHLESGLSSGRLLDPFPEEICRRLVFRMTDVAMCPSTEAVNYMKDNYKTEVVDTAGNTIVDAVALTGAAEVQRNIGAPYLVVSLHRFQNIYKKRRLVHLVSLMEDLSARFDVNFVLHPATRRRLESYKLLDRISLITRIHLRPRMGYKDFLYLAAGAECVLTDGGSNQEELAALGVPTIVMRAHTERLDGLGANIVMEADVKMGVKELILTGGHEDLRCLPAALPSHSPSTRIVGALLGGHLDTHR
ncbi:MAG TPA: UDP-N-acetylglucosamine 2-epimerase, partial [Bellilinea sp.]|nr:UDP-N-acetylglucosamine 2-epimerase [Bellilinea sp.]